MEARDDDRPPGGRPHGALPRRLHFITDSDRGYTLEQIRTVRGSDIIYGELHARPTDEQPQGLLPGIAIMRTADDLPTVGRPFNPEIVTDITRGTTVLRLGLVEIVSEVDEAPAETSAAGLRRSPWGARGSGSSLA